MNLKPIRDYVVIKRDESPGASGRIIIPESAKKQPRFGMVIATGPGKYEARPGCEKAVLIPMQVKTGDRVMFATFAGTEFDQDGEKFVLMEEEHVLGIIES